VTVAAITDTTAETRFVEAAGVDFAYRRFGNSAAAPLLMLQHFRGNLDNWDPALTDALAAQREVILVDYPVLAVDRRAPRRDRADDQADDRVRRRPRTRRDRFAGVLDRRLRRTGDRAGTSHARPTPCVGGQ
jgi:pimeloyl-ACP methyl ester carboxylesterase